MVPPFQIPSGQDRHHIPDEVSFLPPTLFPGLVFEVKVLGYEFIAVVAATTANPVGGVAR